MKLIVNTHEYEINEGYIFAKLIHMGTRTLAEVPEKYIEATKAAYLDLYGEVI